MAREWLVKYKASHCALPSTLPGCTAVSRGTEAGTVGEEAGAGQEIVRGEAA